MHNYISKVPKLFISVDKCKKCDSNAKCVGGECICESGFYGNGYECFPGEITSLERIFKSSNNSQSNRIVTT